MAFDIETLGTDKPGFRAIVAALKEGNPSGTIQPLSHEEAQERAGLCMLSLMQSGLKTVFDRGEKLDLLLRPGVRATVEFLGRFGRADIDKLKRHLDLLAENFDDSQKTE